MFDVQNNRLDEKPGIGKHLIDITNFLDYVSMQNDLRLF